MTSSCRSPFANQMRLILHTGAYWLLLDVRDAIPKWHPLRYTEFATIRWRLHASSRLRAAFASRSPHAAQTPRRSASSRSRSNRPDREPAGR